MSQTADLHIVKDLEFLKVFYQNPQLWNTNNKALFYQMDSKRGISHYELAKINKFGLRVFNVNLKNPIKGESWVSIIFIRKLRSLKK